MMLKIYVSKFGDDFSNRQVAVVREHGVLTIKFSPEELIDMNRYLTENLSEYDGDDATILNGSTSGSPDSLLDDDELRGFVLAIQSAGINVESLGAE